MREGKKLKGKGRAGSMLARFTAPPLTSQRCPRSPPAPPFLSLCAPPALLLPTPLCRSTGLQLPTWLNAQGPRVEGTTTMCVFVCVCVGRRRLTFSSFSLFSPFRSHGSSIKLCLNDTDRKYNGPLQILIIWKKHFLCGCVFKSPYILIIDLTSAPITP